MSVDEFDPYVERLFGQTPPLSDSVHFAAAVEKRMAKGSRVRALALSLAGLIGGVIAVRETVEANLDFSAAAPTEVTRLAGGGITTVGARAQAAVDTGLTDLGLALDMSSMAGMQMFWLASAVMIAAAIVAASRLVQDV